MTGVRASSVLFCAAFFVLSAVSCLTVNAPAQQSASENPTADVEALVSVELTKLAPTDTLAPTSTSVPVIGETPNSPNPTATLDPLHSGPSIAELVTMVRPSLARIITDRGNGSGFVYDEHGMVVTNAHVVVCCKQVSVVVQDKRYDGQVVGMDERADIAVVRINSSDHFHPATFGNAAETIIGDEVIALGFPLSLGRELTATKGIVSSKRKIRAYDYFQHDAPINPGNSGGPLIDFDGLVVGMNTSKRGDAEGIGFAISIAEVEERLGRLSGIPYAAGKRPTPRYEPTQIPTRRPTNTPIPTSPPRPTPRPTRVPTQPPNDPSSPDQYRQVSVGTRHSCGLREDQTIVCWGDPNYGNTSTPGGRFQQISTGWHHNCAIRVNGEVTCWGKNGSQRLENNQMVEKVDGRIEAPSGKFRVVSSGGAHTCGIGIDKTITCWGSNHDHLDQYVGQADPPSGTFIHLGSGLRHTCAVRTNNQITCWGSNQGHGGHAGQSTPPSGSFVQVTSGAYHSCAINTDSRVVCWGWNNDRHGFAGQASPPSMPFSQISAGIYHTCGITPNREAICWGSNKHLIRDEVTGQAVSPNQGEDPGAIFKHTVNTIASGIIHSCGVKDDGNIVCWGSDSNLSGDYTGQATPP